MKVSTSQRLAGVAMFLLCTCLANAIRVDVGPSTRRSLSEGLDNMLVKAPRGILSAAGDGNSASGTGGSGSGVAGEGDRVNPFPTQPKITPAPLPKIPGPKEFLRALPVEQRVIYRPFVDSVEDYILHVYGGFVNLAEADPMIAANSGSWSAGIYTAYEVDYDYDQVIAETTLGPSFKALWTGIGAMRGVGGSRAQGATQASAVGTYLRDLPNANAVEATQSAFANIKGSFLNTINMAERRPSDSIRWPNPFLFEQPALGYKGKK